MKKILSIIMLIITFISIIQVFDAEARRGCCSHHGGVCGCSCCDGKPLSNKCAPYYPECNGGSSYYETSNTYSSGYSSKKYSAPVKSYDCSTMAITSKSGWLLSKPSLNNKKILKTLSRNTKIVKTGGFENDFFQVIVANSTSKGWVHKSVCGCL